MHYTNECPHEDISLRVCVCVCEYGKLFKNSFKAHKSLSVIFIKPTAFMSFSSKGNQFKTGRQMLEVDIKYPGRPFDAIPAKSHESKQLWRLNKCPRTDTTLTFWKLSVSSTHCFVVQNFFTVACLCYLCLSRGIPARACTKLQTEKQTKTIFCKTNDTTFTIIPF